MQAKPLEKATFGYDFRETSSSSHEQVVKKVKKSDVSTTFDHQGEHSPLTYLCDPQRTSTSQGPLWCHIADCGVQDLDDPIFFDKCDFWG